MKIEEKLLKNYTCLNDTDLAIWEYIKMNKDKVTKMSIDQLASETLVSRTTISRFVRKIGLQGYSEFKFRLGIENENSDVEISSYVYEDACNSVIQYVQEQRHKDYSKICEMIGTSKQKFVYGSGDIQIAVAKQVKRMFMSAREVFYDVGGSTFDNAMFDVMNQDDLIILISLSGNNASCLKIAKNAKLKGVKVIAITEFKDNELSRLSDETLYISATPLNFLKEYPDYKMTMIYFLLVELLFIKYSIYKQTIKTE